MYTPVSELAEPDKGLGIFHLLCDKLGHHISGVYIDGADCHDPLPVSLGKVPQQQINEDIQLGNLYIQ